MSLESKNSSGLQRVFTPGDLTEAGWNNCTLQREQKLGRRKGGKEARCSERLLRGCAPKSCWLHWNLVSCIDGLVMARPLM